VAEVDVVDAWTDLFDTITQGLRLVGEGVDLSGSARRHGAARVAALEPVFEGLERDKLLERFGDRVRLTGRGRLLANEVFVRILQRVRDVSQAGSLRYGAG